MSSYRGDIRLGETLDFKFTSRRFTTGAPFTLAGSPVLSAYAGNSTTQITAGITLSVDFDGVTGLNHVNVVASSGNGYATASNYDIVITTGTVDSVSVVGEVVGSFSIEARSGLMPTTAARTLDVTAGGNAGIDWGNVESPTTALNLSATNIDVDQVVASVSGAVASVTAAVTVGTINSGVITATSIAADAITDAKVASDVTIASVTGAVGSVTAAVTVGTINANVITATSINADAITAAKIADGAIDAATFAAGAINAAAIASDAITDAKVASDVTIASVTGAVGSVTGLTAADVGAIKTIADKLDDTLEDDAGTYRFTTNALEQAPTGGSAPTTSQIAEAMFTFDAAATYATANAGSVVKQIADNAGGASLTASDIADEVETRTIAGVTLVATTTNLTNLPAVTTDWLTAAGVKADAVTKIQNGLATPTNITAGTITTTTNLTNAPTSGDLTATMKTSVTTAASAATPVATVSGDLSATMKTSVTTAATAATPTVTLAANAITAAATAADFTTEIQAGLATSSALTTAQSDLDNIQTRLPAALVGGRMDSSTGAINGDADAAATSAILNGATIVYRGTVTGAATTSTLIDSGLTESDVDHWKGRVVIFTSVIPMQATSILAFNPTTDQLTFDPTTQAPTGATFVII